MIASVFVRVLVLVVSIVTFPAYANPLLVTVDTSVLAGSNADIAFDLIDGGSPANTVTLSDFTTDGTTGASSSTGDSSGAFPGVVTLGDTSFFNEYLQSTILGTAFSFRLDSSNLAPDALSFPDSFALFLLDPTTGLPLVTTSDPSTANSLLFWNLGTASPEGYTSDSLRITVRSVPPAGAIPEPTTLLLLTMGLLAAAVHRSPKNRVDFFAGGPLDV